MNLSQDFIESALTILLAALLTGFLIPYILKRIDERKLREQKEVDARKLKEQKVFDAELARQNKIIESQVQLLENLAELLWEYQLSAIAVSYYHSLKSQDLYTTALKKYDDAVGTRLGKIRAEISKAVRLTTPETFQELKDFYNKEILGLDRRLRGLIEGHAKDWHEFNEFAVFELSEKVDNTLNRLAQDLQLKGNDR